MERIEQLKTQIKAARKAYESGAPIMSDKEYDAIEMELRMLAPRCRLLKKVGGKRGNVALLNPMLSLTKAQGVEELPAWTRKAVCTLKIDGIALRLVIRNGQIVLACMRGNGFVGTDCTAQAQRLGLIIDSDFSGDVRGELYQDVDTWKAWSNRPQTSRNNSVRAMMGNPSEVPFYGLHFAAYDMVGSGCNTFSEKLAMLANAGFETAPIVSETVRPCETIDQTDIVKTNGKVYPADGIVFRMDSERAFESAGHDEFSPAGAIAIKWQALPEIDNGQEMENLCQNEIDESAKLMNSMLRAWSIFEKEGMNTTLRTEKRYWVTKGLTTKATKKPIEKAQGDGARHIQTRTKSIKSGITRQTGKSAWRILGDTTARIQSGVGSIRDDIVRGKGRTGLMA